MKPQARQQPPVPYQVWFTTKEAARYLRLSPGRLAHMRPRGIGPRFSSVKLPGSRKATVRYHIDWLDAWLISGKEAA